MTTSWRTRTELVYLVVTLAKQGTTRRAIARALGVSRNTVRAVLDAHEAGRDAEHIALEARPLRAPRPTKLDLHKARIRELTGRYPDITAQRVYEILRDEGSDASYSGVKRYVRALRPPPRPTPSLPTPDYGPGEMSESDWSPYEVRFTTGKTATVHALSYVLVHSRRKYFGLYESNDLHALMDGHERAFTRFDACAAACKYDSQKPVVLRWEGSQPIYNPRFLAFSSHYEFRPLAVRRNHPNDKPRTERSFWEVERSFLNGREFRDLDDMRAQLADWVERIVDHRKLHKRTALERFAEEKAHLVQLPRHPYDTARVVYRICSIDGFVAWAGNQYAIPYEHVTDILPVRITQRELFVYAADLRCVARHELVPRGAGLKLDPSGLHPAPKAHKNPIDAEQLRIAFERMGERAADFFCQLSTRGPRAWVWQARRIVLLRERYSTEELDAALGHATSFGVLEYAAVERILAARSQPRTLDEYIAEESARRIEETLGHARTEPRDLTEYDRLPVTPVSRLRTQENTAWPSETDVAHQEPTTISSSNDCADTSRPSD